MSIGQFDPHAIAPSASNISVGTSPVKLTSSSVLSVKFTLVAPPGNTMYFGNSSVSSTKGVPIPKGTSITFGPDKMFDHKSIAYDLAQCWVICTAATQTATLVTYNRSGGSGPY